MKKPPAFKNSELGPIPADWEVKRIGDVCSRICNGVSYDYRENGTVPVSRIETISNGKIDMTRIGHMRHVPTPDYKLQKGDILYSHINSLSHIGKVAVFDADNCLYHGMNLLLLRPNEGVDGNLFFFHLRSESLQRQALQSAKAAVSQASISIQELSNFCFPVPKSRQEQRCIAAALSDADAWIESLDKLIEKKKLVKQGAMQALLSGKTRLPGFSGEWEKRLLGEVAIFPTDTVPTDTTRLSDYVGTENMLPGGVGVVEYEDTLPYENIREYRIGDVLISNIRPYLKKIWLADRNGGCSTDVVVIRTRDKGVLTPEFLFAQLAGDSFFDFVMDNAIGTKMPRGDKRMMGLFSMPVPSFAEQCAITKVLSDMDAELAALSREKAKAERIKEGMMQELLTGKTRLKGEKRSNHET